VSFGTRARPQAALLAAPEIARTADHLPRRDTLCGIGACNTPELIHRRAASSAQCTTTVTSKGTCGPGAARLGSAEKRRAAGRARAEGHARFNI